MVKKNQTQPLYERLEDLEAKQYTDNLKAQWDQAAKEFQGLWNSVHSVSRRYVEVEQEIRTAQAREERLNLIRERAELQVELEVLPLEAGAAKREEELARFHYFEAEEQRLQKWHDALSSVDDEKYYNPQTREYEYPDALLAEVADHQQAFKDWERAAKEAGIALENIYGQPREDWRNETFWEAHASKRQAGIIQQAIRSRDNILNPPPPPYAAFQS